MEILRHLRRGYKLAQACDRSPTALPQLPTLKWAAAGFVASKCAAAAIELGVFAALSRDAMTPAQLAEAVQVNEEALFLLLETLVHFGFVEHRHGRYRDSAVTASFLVPGKPSYLGAELSFFIDDTWNAFGPMHEVLKAYKNPPRGVCYDTAKDQGAEVVDYAQRVRVTAEIPGRLLAESVDLSGFHRLLDVGGGLGQLSTPHLERHPHLAAVVLDLPEVCQAALQETASCRHRDRLIFHAGNFLQDPWPAGCDAIQLVRVLHDWPDAIAQRLTASAHAALPPGGILLIYEIMRTRPLRADLGTLMAYWNILIYLDGAIRAPAQYRQMLAAAGFTAVTTVASDDIFHDYTLMTARK